MALKVKLFGNVVIVFSVLIVFSGTLIIWIVNGLSEQIKQNMANLQDTIANMPISEGAGLVEMYGNYHSEEYARTILVNKMSKFLGFDAGGFFTLGKPLLNSIFINFITYIIILIQFKITELSTNKPSCSCLCNFTG